MSNQEAHNNEAPGQNKEYKIYVNGRERTVSEKEISFREVVVLALGTYEENDTIVYTVTYSKGEDKKEGSMTKGTMVKVKEGMIFNVTPINRS